MKTTTNSAFPIFPRVTTVFLLELTEATFGHIVNIVHARKQKYADLLSKLGAVCENFSRARESMAESIDRAPAKPSPAKRRRFQTFEKACHEKWPLVAINEKS